MTNIILSLCLIGFSFLFKGLYACIDILTDNLFASIDRLTNAVRELNKTIKENTPEENKE